MNPQPPILTPEQKRRQRGRNLAIFAALLAFVALVYGITIVKIKMGYAP